MIEKNKFITANAEPNPSAMINSFRAVGYTFEAAIADIIDNSISAGAKNVWIDYSWEGEKTKLSIRDDGWGMNNVELINAMRPGSKNPLDERDLKDLGRYGLGLKTASFSQCEELTVLSKKQSYNTIFWTWDLDYVSKTKKWELIKKEQCEEDVNYLSV